VTRIYKAGSDAYQLTFNFDNKAKIVTANNIKSYSSYDDTIPTILSFSTAENFFAVVRTNVNASNTYAFFYENDLFNPNPDFLSETDGVQF
jgi:hypothetical protein